MTLLNRTSGIALLAILTAAVSQTALAREVRVDFGDTNFGTSGENFTTDDTTFGVGVGSISFQLNLGSGAQSYDYCMSANGFVAFTAAGTGCSGSSSTPAGDYVAAFLAPLALHGNTLRGFGLVDSSPAYSAADATSAYRFIWDATDSSNNAILAELLLLDRGAGNFDLQFAYGNALFNLDGAPSTGTQAIQLGGNSNSLGGPFSSATNYAFSFNGGTCAACVGSGIGGGGGSVSVPEPSTLALMVAAMSLLLFSRRRSVSRWLA
jgi:hypothetical protein